MRANKLETALSRDHLAYLAPPDMFFSHVHVALHTPFHIYILYVYDVKLNQNIVYNKLNFDFL